MNKRFLKFFSKIFSKPIAQVGFYLLGIAVIFLISGVFDDFETSFNKIINLLSAQETISVFLAGILSLGIARIIKRCDYYLEESLKIEDDHHKIIRKYNGHPKQELEPGKNYFDKTGALMNISHTKAIRKSEWKNREKDKFSKIYWTNEEELLEFSQNKLYTPSINVFTNRLGDTKIVFDDSNEPHKLPSFIIKHADELLLAHKNSSTRNNNTIRLNDFDYDGENLTLRTQRSTYYHMLITNRCMDYSFANGLTIRNLYEYQSRICPLHKSKFGNQIGINGLIITSDGYVLLEKRDHKKTTWKNKFAQSISLALKADEIVSDKTGVIGNKTEDAAEGLKRVIQKTIRKNFGITEKDCEPFVLETNFLGLARDLLEGGKPNLYFFVETTCTAEDLAKKMKETAGSVESICEDEEKVKKIKGADGVAETADEVEALANIIEKSAKCVSDGFVMSTEKMNSDYYLVKFSDIKINYNYVMNLDRKKAIKVQRKVYPRVPRRLYILNTVKYWLARTFAPKLQRECGEALMVTLSYLELCKDRIAALKSRDGREE